MSSEALMVTPTLVIPGADLLWSAARASGPGGQNVNKVATKVELRFDLPGTRCLDEAVKSRLRTLCAGRLDADGWVQLSSQKTRDQSRNLDDARERLRALILRALEAPAVRRATKPSRASKQRRLNEKRQTSVRKEGRRPPKDHD
ncbi:MAG: aminoacyl-tRNA hydrolase [Deltaproteobacteria bacterium]|nr:aminoacyl-tRNA hydrolase [Deltaproteobacteria bacterium]